MNVEDMTFGIEIETTIPMDSIPVGPHGHGYPVATMPGWLADADPSIRTTPGYKKCEFVSPVFKGTEGLKQLLRDLETIKGFGAKVNGSCGLHIHVGIDKTNAKLVEKLRTLVANFEKAIFASTGTKSREMGRWCAGLQRYGSADAARRTNDYCRYQVLNFNTGNKPTVEFRAFGATLNAKKISGHVKMCVALVERAARAFEVNELDRQSPDRNEPDPSQRGRADRDHPPLLSARLDERTSTALSRRLAGRRDPVLEVDQAGTGPPREEIRRTGRERRNRELMQTGRAREGPTNALARLPGDRSEGRTLNLRTTMRSSQPTVLILNDAAKLAVKKWRDAKPWQGTEQEKGDKMAEVHRELCRAYDLETILVRDDSNPNGFSGGSAFQRAEEQDRTARPVVGRDLSALLRLCDRWIAARLTSVRGPNLPPLLPALRGAMRRNPRHDDPPRLVRELIPTQPATGFEPGRVSGRKQSAESPPIELTPDEGGLS